jgi:hypothetical protein
MRRATICCDGCGEETTKDWVDVGWASVIVCKGEGMHLCKNCLNMALEYLRGLHRQTKCVTNGPYR